MWEKLRELLRGAPLLCLLLLMWFLLTLASIFGRGRAYRAYSTQYGKIPGVSLVMRGLHDHVLPWSPAPGAGGEEEDTDGEADTDEEDTVEVGEVKDAEGADPEGREHTQDDAAGKGEAGKEEADQKDDAAGKGEAEAAKEDAGKKDDAAGKGEAEAGKEEADQKDDASEKNAASEKDDAAASAEDPSAREKQTSDKETDSGKTAFSGVPESSGTRVVPAKDYGVANSEYLSPPDAVYNTDTEGLFAPNGTFYALQEVDDSYFSDALFIGDSRTVGLFEYGNMQSITSFLARESTTVYDLFDDNEKMDYNPLGRKTMERTLKDLLSKAKFRKIYLSVGVNELGIPDTMDYYREFRKVIRKIHKLQPEAVIYIQGIMHVSRSRSKKDAVFNNTAIVQRNQAISTLANGRNIFYIDMNADLCDADGNLRDELTGDGIHLKASACELWHAFLKKHAAVIPD